MELTKTTKSFGYLDFVVLILSFYVLGTLFIDTIFILPKEISRILDIIDDIICLLFLLDFGVRLHKAESKFIFLKWGWLDLLSCIPFLDFFRAGRILRLIKLLRIIRAFRSMINFTNHVFENRMQGTFASASVIAVLLMIFSSIAILHVEVHPNSNIKTAEDALWWAYVTITTVGYGDKFPVTMEGRIIASILMTAGVGLFGIFSGFLASWFVKGNELRSQTKTSS